MVKNQPANAEDLRDTGWEDPLEDSMATHSSILAWRIPWIEDARGLQSMGSQSQTRLKRLSTYTRTIHFGHTYKYIYICSTHVQMQMSMHTHTFTTITKFRSFPGGPVFKTSPFNAGGESSIPGREVRISHAWRPKNQNIKQKQYCKNSTRKTLILIHIKKKIFFKESSENIW